MPEVIINDVPIDFPHPVPYNVQRTYMEKVIECLRDSKNGVLESPTGTGKTLSLLCSSLAWLKQKKDELAVLQASINSESLSDKPSIDSVSLKIPKIIYASRTHTQLTQAIKELKGTSYSHMKVGVFGSRDQLCIHPDLQYENNAAKTEMCQSKITMRFDPGTDTQRCECSFYKQYLELEKNGQFRKENFDNKILDIEDLVTSGQQHHFCPYFMSKTMVEDADIVFMPYNYLLDPKIRNFIGVELKDAVVILDEAHNVPQVCEDSASVEFKSSHFTDAIAEVGNISDFINANRNDSKLAPTTFNSSELNDLKSILLRFKKSIDEIQLFRVSDSNSLVAAEFDGDFIFTIMENADIAYHTSRNITLLIKNVLQYVADCINHLKSSQRTSSQVKVRLSSKSPGLRVFNDILWKTFANCGDDFREDIKRHYRVYVASGTPQMSQSNGPVKIINYWCFSPKFGLEYLIHKKRVRCIIFTSGTMSPLQPFITSLGIPIDVRLQNSHIIDQSQVLVEIISVGPDNEQLSSNYWNRSNPKYLHSLGNTVLKLSQVIPHGLLVFFASYEILYMCKADWQNKGIWSQIEQIKPIFIEPKTKNEFANTMKGYYRQINDETMKGAIFMAVCRGKVSEGLDFADMNGRAVIITGLPFPPMLDPKIRLKRMYMERNCTTGNESLSGDQWYQLEASRAVNQAIGRVIRHRLDYGAILLCDSRFNKTVQKSQLSQWIQRHIRSHNSRRSFDSITDSILQFFRTQETATVHVTSRSTVMSQDNQILSRRTSDQVNDVGQPMTSQDCQTSLRTSKELFGIDQSTSENHAIPESPISIVARQIASIPLSSPTSAELLSFSNNANSNGTPSKQRCAINLSQSFDAKN